MWGVVVNSLAIFAGTLVGLCFKRLISNRIAEVMSQALGMCAFVIGIKMALRFENVLELLLCVVAGGVVGTALSIEQLTERLALRLQRRFSADENSRFAAGLSMSSIMFCTGAMAIVGPINSALLNDHEVIFTKSMLDGIMSASLASIYGIGVGFSAVPILIYQGTIALLAGFVKELSTPEILNDISGVGGVLVMMIGLNQAKLARIPVGDFTPAILLVIITEMLMFRLF
jgi:uncharacterized membrane protein YqgA involved in biofilm formation